MINKWMSKQAAILLFIYRKYGSSEWLVTGRKDKMLQDFILKIKGEKLYCSSALAQYNLEKKCTDIQWIENRIGETLEEDITSNHGIAITSENDLFEVDTPTLNWLGKDLNLSVQEVEKHQCNHNLCQISLWMHELILKLLKDAKESRNLELEDQK